MKASLQTEAYERMVILYGVHRDNQSCDCGADIRHEEVLSQRRAELV